MTSRSQSNREPLAIGFGSKVSSAMRYSRRSSRTYYHPQTGFCIGDVRVLPEEHMDDQKQLSVLVRKDADIVWIATDASARLFLRLKPQERGIRVLEGVDTKVVVERPSAELRMSGLD